MGKKSNLDIEIIVIEFMKKYEIKSLDDLDSFQIVSLIINLENELDINLLDEDLTFDDFSDMNSIIVLVNKCLI
ncbi:hypothetical protein GPY51_03690 [Photorhabdus laumondii subsp. laumondii]|nr:MULTISPECIES: hypothetical protein [Photorhabdus]AWK42165.1 hypothetical protein A4R40_12005 [Photorhabdus laumondii subsp. laumondii]AXG43026.1 hypothetical protein PluDJC_12720 [Photorhabdus laumondii subsp. laumondii]AXG47485.1 hypothetical protein PluTT01m_12380 [Photorhabdus laumondii subsp. laumondii]MCC8415077.1 hypothetical protein [Photorhabdus laumondii]MCZ1250335.1 hypothetical protein [Photorhabdus laumondii subsp. laumondii]